MGGINAEYMGRRKSSAVEDTDFCLILIFIKKPTNQDV